MYEICTTLNFRYLFINCVNFISYFFLRAMRSAMTSLTQSVTENTEGRSDDGIFFNIMISIVVNCILTLFFASKHHFSEKFHNRHRCHHIIFTKFQFLKCKRCRDARFSVHNKRSVITRFYHFF